MTEIEKLKEENAKLRGQVEELRRIVDGVIARPAVQPQPFPIWPQPQPIPVIPNPITPNPYPFWTQDPSWTVPGTVTGLRPPATIPGGICDTACVPFMDAQIFTISPRGPTS